jgi:curved DNA-binding protein CbpA
MRRAVDYYGVLGVGREAGPEELKRRFRQLARQFHPDVADDPEAAQQQFILVVEAYRTLSDPALRRTYDALATGGVAPPPATRSVQIRRQIDDWFRHAVHSFEAGELTPAAAQCRKILAIDPQYAAAHALLGDVHGQREEWDAAISHYSGAVSAAPRNAVYARKLRAALDGGQLARAAEDRRRKLAEQRQKAIAALNARHEYIPYAVLLALAWMLVLLTWSAMHPGAEVAGWLPLPRHVALAAAASGLMLGVVLACVGVSPGEARGPGWVTVLLGLMSLGLFYLSAAAYCVWSLLRYRLVPSLTAAYTLTVVLVIGLAALAAYVMPTSAGAWRPVALLAGNLIFPFLLLGHKLGRVGLRPAS